MRIASEGRETMSGKTVSDSPVSSIKRVALIVNALNPGGKERVIMHLAMQFAEVGVEPIIVCIQSKTGLGPQIQEAGIEVHAAESYRSYSLATVWWLRRLLRRFHPDIINVHDYSSLPYAVAANRLGGHRPLVLSCHGLLFDQRREGARFHHRLAARSASAVTAVSADAARDYAEFLGLSGPVTVIENGIPIMPRRPDLGKAVRRELGLDDNTFMFAAVGNIKPEKGFKDLAVAADILRGAALSRPFAVVIAGGPTDMQCLSDLQSLIARLRLEPLVRLLGQREDTLAIYSAADAFVLSSRSEGLPLVLLEAMSVGLPVVATTVGGIPDVLRDCGGGILVTPASPPALAEGMTKMLTSPKLCEELGARGAEAVGRRYSVRTMTLNYLAFFERVVRGEGSPVDVDHSP